MAKVLLVLAAIGVTIYAAIDCFRSEDAEIRGMPKALWLLVILLIPLFGGLLWLLLGRQPLPGARPSRRLRTIGPDDDPDFLRTLKPPRPRNTDRRHTEPEDDDPKPS
jgi:hypothetical protein